MWQVGTLYGGFIIYLVLFPGCLTLILTSLGIAVPPIMSNNWVMVAIALSTCILPILCLRRISETWWIGAIGVCTIVVAIGTIIFQSTEHLIADDASSEVASSPATNVWPADFASMFTAISSMSLAFSATVAMPEVKAS